MYKKLLSFWKLAAHELNFKIKLDHTVPLKSGQKIQSLFLVKGFGAEKGMLILAEGVDISLCNEELNELGYGYSYLSEPFDNEEYSAEDYAELLDDWGKWGNT